MSTGAPQSQAELLEQLQDHVEFLQSSCEAYDSGKTNEAKRLSVSLRVLFHDTTTGALLIS